MGIERPKVALLNIGEEEEKGNMVTKEAYKLMSDSADFEFVGNMEANRLFDGDIADVLVTMVFPETSVLSRQKECKSFKKTKYKNDFLEGFNYEDYGGTPVLGVTGTGDYRSRCLIPVSCRKYDNQYPTGFGTGFGRKVQRGTFTKLE